MAGEWKLSTLTSGFTTVHCTLDDKMKQITKKEVRRSTQLTTAALTEDVKIDCPWPYTLPNAPVLKVGEGRGEGGERLTDERRSSVAHESRFESVTDLSSFCQNDKKFLSRAQIGMMPNFIKSNQGTGSQIEAYAPQATAVLKTASRSAKCIMRLRTRISDRATGRAYIQQFVENSQTFFMLQPPLSKKSKCLSLTEVLLGKIAINLSYWLGLAESAPKHSEHSGAYSVRP
ncbi:hypothetical protein ACFE04_019885 [Oxalis oulophora]